MSRAPIPIELTDDDIKRFWAKVDKSSDCWLWTAATTHGYGVFGMKRIKRNLRAHRVSYTLLIGPIPDGLVTDHLCRNRLCVNPAHLELVTNRENVLRGEGIAALLAARATCAHGHPWTPDSTRWVTWRGKRSRQCRTCDRERAMERGRAAGARPISEASKYHTKTHCKRGHELTPENRFPSNGGCKACERLRRT